MNTRSTIWSCLAAHAAVLHLDGIERQRLNAKCSGVFDCAKTNDHWLTENVASPLKVSHSRLNALRKGDLTGRGYQVLTESPEAGVDMFAKQFRSRFIFFQGHPEYDTLSLQRANFIRQRLTAEAPVLGARTKTSGMGFRQNIVGSGTDNAVDALDRRVEFKIIPCS